MKLARKGNKKKARIEIIPLIDIMFFLLATFVLVSFSMIENHGLAVSLPSSKSSDTATAQAGPQQSEIVVSITATGDLSINKEPVPREELEKRMLTFRKQGEPSPQVKILADKASDVELTVAIMDAARTLGMDNVLLQTRSQ